MNSGHQYCGDVVQVGNRVQKFREGEKVLQAIKRCRQVVLKGIFLDEPDVYVDVMVSEAGGI